MIDKSNGYEAAASRFIPGRNLSDIGAAVVRDWSRALPTGAAVLDVGCGSGVPISEVLIERGFEVHGLDASFAMITAFRQRFPTVAAEWSAVEDSTFFDRTFDAVVAWGLMFLLDPETQRILIGKVASALRTGGKFLFTSPSQACSWLDSMTGRESRSLGREGYREILEAKGLMLVDERQDEGENHYYFVSKA